MESIFDPAGRATLETRLRALRPDSVRQWGRMTPHQAVCHMSDVFRMALREKTVAPRAGAFAPVVRFVALRLPMRWPRGIKTTPECEQGCGGTTPIEFERDRAELVALMARFGTSSEADRPSSHPIFGRMTTTHWGCWAYRHVDHHLRQFGA